MKLSLKTAFASLASVIVLSATGVAMADEDTAPTPAPAAPTPAATPLQTRPAKKLELSPPNESSSVGYKLLAGAVVVAGAVVYARKKKGALTNDASKKTSSIDLLGRHSVGVRSEVLVVEVEGTRLLVGLTPGSMSTLAVLQTPEGVVGEESPFMGEEKFMTASERAEAEQRPLRPFVGKAEALSSLVDDDDDEEPPAIRVGARKAAEQEAVEELEGRVRSLVEARKKKAELPPVTTPTPKAPRKPRAAAGGARGVPGQAKGLLLSMQDPDATKLGDR